MNDVPLIQKADINSINTSIIAIKKQLKQLNEALGLVDVPSIDTSVFVKKSDVVDVVESGNMNPVTSNAVVPVDEVTSGNMQSVTSNAVHTKITTQSSDKMGSWGILGGAQVSSRTNFVDLIRDVTGATYGGGICGGSINTTTTSKGIPSGWYNYLYIPHRTGIGGSDNYKYGNLLVFPMANMNTFFYKIQLINDNIYNAVRYSGTQL